MTIKQKLVLLDAILVALEHPDNPVIKECRTLQDALDTIVETSEETTENTIPIGYASDREVVQAAHALILDPASWGASDNMCQSLGRPHPVTT